MKCRCGVEISAEKTRCEDCTEIARRFEEEVRAKAVRNGQAQALAKQYGATNKEYPIIHMIVEMERNVSR